MTSFEFQGQIFFLTNQKAFQALSGLLLTMDEYSYQWFAQQSELPSVVFWGQIW